MKNADVPAMPQEGDLFCERIGNCPTLGTGLTKREQACITLGIPETGDPDLDALILRSERKRIAAMAMQGMLSNKYVSEFNGGDAGQDYKLCQNAVGYADALLGELSK